MSEANAQLALLRQLLRDCGSVLCCFSGGVDSTLVVKVALDVLGEHAWALTVVSPTMAASERADALALGHELGLGERHLVRDSRELERPGFRDNPSHRCYLCKSELFEIARPEAARLGLAEILLGTNRDDLGDHRPGLMAADEHGARHPLVEAGLTKAAVRQISRDLGLRTWDKPQLACLSSRFPYGTEITPERLARVDQFEDALRELGFRQLRVRFHDAVARLELDPEEMRRALEPGVRKELLDAGRALGFTYVALDLAGYRTGAMNEALPVAIRRRA